MGIKLISIIMGLMLLMSCATTSKKICYNQDVYMDSALNIIDTYTCEEGGYIFDYEEIREVGDLHLKMRNAW